MLFASKSAVDDLHLDGLDLCAAYKLGAAQAHVLSDGYFHGVAIAVIPVCRR